MKAFRILLMCLAVAPAFSGGIAVRAADTQTLALQLQSERALDRMKAVQTLGEMRNAEAAALLVKCLNDPHIGVRTGAAGALVRIGPPAVRPLVQCLSSSNKDLRRAAARALGDIGDMSAVEALTPLLADPDASVKRVAEASLASLNAKAKAAARMEAERKAQSKPSPPVDPNATAEFKSKQGFSFAYPAHWAIATKEQTRDIARVLKSVAPNIQQADMNRVAVLVYDAASREFAESLNVVVSRGAMPINDQSREQYAAAVTDGYRRASGNVTDINVSVTQVAGRDAMTIRFLASWPQVNKFVRHWQVAVPAKCQTFIFTCSARDADWARLEPVFERMINSVQLEPDIASSFDTLPGYARGIIIGGLIGGLIGFFIMAFIKIAGLWRKPSE
ncbi:MAG: HEAT repeat domain-containing protein [Verrucomicrobia bacterium]|nr:HEAT repeat domain-containing protein [Verrucomicrobiota bacterium]